MWEELRVSWEPSMIVCEEHKQHARSACKKIGSRYYCPINGDYLGAKPASRSKLPVAPWRNVYGEYRTQGTPDSILERERELKGRD